MNNRIFVIGDIHGCIDKLENLMAKLPINWAKDNILFLGDYIDRGAQPKDVVQFIIELKKTHGEKVICLKGNHEEMFLDFLNGGELSEPFLSYGGDKTLLSYNLSASDKGAGREAISPSHFDFFSNLKINYSTDRFFMVHAGVKPNVPLSLQKEEDMLWIRDKFIRSRFDWGKRIIFGHTVFETPLIQENKIGIDTGAVYGGMLTCLVIPEVDFIFA